MSLACGLLQLETVVLSIGFMRLAGIKYYVFDWLFCAKSRLKL